MRKKGCEGDQKAWEGREVMLQSQMLGLGCHWKRMGALASQVPGFLLAVLGFLTLHFACIAEGMPSRGRCPPVGR